MDAHDLERSVKWMTSFRTVGAARVLRSVRAAWWRRRADGAGLSGPGPERARVPGAVRGAEPAPGGGLVHFARSSLRVRVAAGGAVFCGWDGAAPEPSYALAGPVPEADERAVLEPDRDGGWRVVSERVLVVVSRHGAVEVRTPGGVVLRRDHPPRWWDPVEPAADGAGPRWAQRSEVPADARFFGLGGRSAGPRLRDGVYRLWNEDPGGSFGPGDDPLYITMPVQLVVADAGTHLVFHDNPWDGRVTLWEGEEGAGSGHDRPGRCEVRVGGGPLRSWVITGPPARVLRGWAALTGGAAVPPAWALGPQHARWGFGDEEEVRRVVAGYRERGLPLCAVHLDIDHYRGHRVFTADGERFPDLPGLAAELREEGVRLVSIVDPGVKAEPGWEVFDGGMAADAFVRDARGRVVRGEVWSGTSVFPDFTDPRAREWWGGLYAERLARGFSGFWHDMNEPSAFTAFGEPTLPRSARHALDGAGGDHRAAHNVYALGMARAGYEALRALRPDERPFLFSRSGWAGMQRYGGTWSGDVVTGWPGLRASLSLVLGLGLCGVPYSGPDVGGFTGSPSPELYLRWFQLGAYLPLFRTHSAISAGRREPWEFGREVLEHAGAALRERMRLLPYFVTLAHLARLTGAPYVRPVWWRSPEDRALRDCEDQFLLGDALLVAPVLEPGVERRAVRLPRGRWYDVVTGRAYEGPGQVLLDAPLSRIPVLVRAGSVIPVVASPSGAEPVSGACGEVEVELEVWAPAVGRAGGGVVVAEPSEEVVRFAVGWRDGVVVVEREGGGGVGYPVRVRGV
ncbi:glycosyl hydrolase [Streptomyces sp. AV19]|uniref:glycoside hydrolase family 31 protein n=1 Tax=Streptomyces sp. AV19 TaxID=2793068 RepID=UPI0018FEAF69|nr:glycoside hydrolase family 31 protein [Streptomyces sp. AV19]MBH1937005.1 glycosyl hydrolase [Streptomyces sp. AV19]MDG4533053.1 glycoside hydrolase family 31 protein [Streptomyces sp. AV19]